jgi:hypothetical protein
MRTLTLNDAEHTALKELLHTHLIELGRAVIDMTDFIRPRPNSVIALISPGCLHGRVSFPRSTDFF